MVLHPWDLVQDHFPAIRFIDGHPDKSNSSPVFSELCNTSHIIVGTPPIESKHQLNIRNYTSSDTESQSCTEENLWCHSVFLCAPSVSLCVTKEVTKKGNYSSFPIRFWPICKTSNVNTIAAKTPVTSLATSSYAACLLLPGISFWV